MWDAEGPCRDVAASLAPLTFVSCGWHGIAPVSCSIASTDVRRVKMSTASVVRQSAARWVLGGFMATAVLGGCAAPKQVGKGATEGALEGVKEQSQPRPNGP